MANLEICTNMKLKDFTIKSCRTTYADRRAENGIHELIIQSWLGHTSFKTTKRHCLKINADFVESEFEKAVKYSTENI